MKKMKLQLDALEVDSFETSTIGSERRTVFAHITLNCATLTDCPTEAASGCCGGTRDDPTCIANPTCINTCQGWTCEFDTCSAECTATTVPECNTNGRYTCGAC